MIHNSILVTVYGEDRIKEAHAHAKTLFPLVSEIIESPGWYYSFFIPPVGISEEAAQMQTNRKDFMRWIRTKAYPSGENVFKVVEIKYGDRDSNPFIVDFS